MRRTMRSKAAASRVWPRKIFSWLSGRRTWPTRASTAPPANRWASSLTKWKNRRCGRCRPACFLSSRKRHGRCIEMATWSSNEPITRCPRSMWAAKSGCGKSRGSCAFTTRAANRSPCTHWPSRQVHHRSRASAQPQTAHHRARRRLPAGSLSAHRSTDGHLGPGDASEPWPAKPARDVGPAATGRKAPRQRVGKGRGYRHPSWGLAPARSQAPAGAARQRRATGLPGNPSPHPLAGCLSHRADAKPQLTTHPMSQLDTTLRQLRLSGLLQSLGVRLQAAAAARLGHGEFLELILQDELNVRHQRMLARRTKAAGFRGLKSLEDFDWQFNPSISRKQIFELAAGQYQREAKDVLFLGPPGVGKTHLAQALGYAAIKQGKDVCYRSISDLARDFMKDEALNQLSKVLRNYLKPDLVIIDDMGLKQLPKHSGEYLLEVIMSRYENRSTIMTSNRPLEDLGKLLSDVPTAGVILDRFLHYAITVAINGRSYRVKDSLSPRPENKPRTKSNEPAS